MNFKQILDDAATRGKTVWIETVGGSQFEGKLKMGVDHILVGDVVVPFQGISAVKLR